MIDTLGILAGAKVPFDPLQAMAMAIQFDQVKLMKFLKIKMGALYMQNALLWTNLGIEHSSLKCIVQFADWASENGNLEVINLLYEEGINFATDFSPIILRNAVVSNNLNLLKYIYGKPGIDLNQNGCEVFDIAAGHGYMPIVHWLLSLTDISGQKVLKLDFGNSEAITFAAARGDLETIKILERMPELKFEKRATEAIGLAGHFGRSDVLEYFALWAIDKNSVEHLEDVFHACFQRGLSSSYVFTQQVTQSAFYKAKEGFPDPMNFMKGVSVFDFTALSRMDPVDWTEE